MIKQLTKKEIGVVSGGVDNVVALTRVLFGTCFISNTLKTYHNGVCIKRDGVIEKIKCHFFNDLLPCSPSLIAGGIMQLAGPNYQGVASVAALGSAVVGGISIDIGASWNSTISS